MPDESTPTCQRYLCKNPTTRITGLVVKDEVWIISTCDHHGPRRRTQGEVKSGEARG